MASGVPIVASRTEAMCEVLNAKNAVLVSPDDSIALAEGIMHIILDTQCRETITRKAKSDVVKFDWSNRTLRTLTFLSKAKHK
jgi:glycosyltransferase involved in cell wall biosynthesis